MPGHAPQGDDVNPARRNIQTIARLDEAALHEQSTTARISAAITSIWTCR